MLDSAPADWRAVRLDSVLRRDTTSISVAQLEKYELVRHYSLPAFDDGKEPVLEAGAGIKSNKTLIADDCLLFSKLNPRIPRVWRVNQRHHEPAVCSTEFWALQPIDERASLDFFSHFFTWHGFLEHSNIKPASSTNSHQRVDRKAFDGFVLNLPPLPEQERIAEILTSVDDSIRATEAVIAQAERVKRGLMEDLLTGGLGSEAIARGEVPEGWENRRLEELIVLVSGQHIDAKDVNAQGDGVPYLTGPADFPSGEIIVTKFTLSPKQFCEQGDILITVKGSGAGKSIRANDRYCISRQLMAARAEHCSAEWLSVVFEKFTEELSEKASGIIPGVSRVDILKYKVAVPPASEQERIASCFAGIEAQLVSNRRAVQQLQRLKRGLMDDLLTGRVRTV